MDKTKAKIQELCPDVIELKCYDLPQGLVNIPRDITLAVVLRAIRTTLKKHDDVQLWASSETVELSCTRGTYDGEGDSTSFAIWNLEHDNYDQQSEECKQFIGSLLGVNN